MDMSETSLIAQLIRCRSAVPVRRIPHQPNPPGTIKAGSATDEVARFLESCRAFKTEAQIIWATKRSHSAVSWALFALTKSGRIKRVPDAGRNERYCRYIWRTS